MKRLLLLAGLATIAFTGPALADTNLKLVEVITSPQRTEFLKGQIGKFEAANPGMHVEIVSLPWGEAFEKFLTMVQAGETPDIAEMPERWMSLYANNGQLEDLSAYIAKWDEAKTLGDRAVQFSKTVNDTPYMVPYGFYLRGLYWNKKLFQEAGVAAPPKTLDEFMDGVEEDRGAGRRQDRLLPARRQGRHRRHRLLHADHGRQGQVLQRRRHLDPRRRRRGQGHAVPGRPVQGRRRAEGQPELGLQRDRHRLLLRHLRDAGQRPGRA